MDNQVNTLVLFDVDGTLTEARKPITFPIINALRELCHYAEIGFLTGSGMEYIKEQLWPALNDSIIRKNCHILPCNGTEYLIPVGGETLVDFRHIHAAYIREEMGTTAFQELMKILCSLQAELLQEEFNIPLTGNFIQNRGSIINWCPIGRNAVGEDRREFVSTDKLYGIRQKYLDKLTHLLKDKGLNVVVKLGGHTSFDIYPPGWDKTYALRHFDKDKWDFWFVGDRCHPNGNDYEIFTLLKDKERSFETSSPEQTVEIIDLYILEHLYYRR